MVVREQATAIAMWAMRPELPEVPSVTTMQTTLAKTADCRQVRPQFRPVEVAVCVQPERADVAEAT